MSSHGLPMWVKVAQEVQLEIHLGQFPLNIRGSGRIPAELFPIGETLETKGFARSEQLRDR